MTNDPLNTMSVLLGIGGGVAAYKAVEVARVLAGAGVDTHVAMTASARHFVEPHAFEEVIGRPVHADMFSQSKLDLDSEAAYPHLYPATRCDACILLPATANLMAEVAHGFGGNIVCASALSLPEACRRYFCPSMNVEMWGQQTVRENARRLCDLGWVQIGPDEGRLACGMEGLGRLTEPDVIADQVLQDLRAGLRLKGLRVLILSGPTVEPFDPVRFISNKSSGKLGRALAMAAVQSGAEVSFISGPVHEENLPRSSHIQIDHVTTAAQMLARAEIIFPDADVMICVAAIADFTPAETMELKLPKSDAETLSVQLVPTADIASTLSARKRSGQLCIGFALETHDGEAHALAKMHGKHLDAVILNGIDSFAADNGEFMLFRSADGDAPLNWGRIDKVACARKVMDVVAEELA